MNSAMAKLKHSRTVIHNHVHSGLNGAIGESVLPPVIVEQAIVIENASMENQAMTVVLER